MNKNKYAQAIVSLFDCNTLTENEMSVLNCYIEHQNFENPSCCQGESADCCNKNIIDNIKIKLINKPVETTNEQPKDDKLNYMNGSGGSHGW